MRKMTNAELAAFQVQLDNRINVILNVAQVKASLRLMRDEEGLDKELLEYANRALNQRMLGILQECVPKPQKPQSFVSMAEKIDDPIIRLLIEAPDWVLSCEDNYRANLSDCTLECGAPALGMTYTWGVRLPDSRWCLLKNVNNPNAEIWCASCSWMTFLISKDTKELLCSTCKRKLAWVSDESNNLL